MRFLLLLMVALFLKAGGIYNLKLTKITDGVFCSIGDTNPPTKLNKGNVNNSCFIDLGDSLVVIDAGPSYEFAKEFASLAKAEAKKPIKAVVITNYHDDRLYGASYYKEKNIPIIAHKNILKDIKNNPQKFERMKRILTKKEFAKTKLITPDTLFDKEYIIKGSKRSVKLLKLTPVSEEKSDIVVWVPDIKFLFAGNIVFNDRALNYTKNSNIDGWIEAIKKIEALKPNIVLGGHGKTFGKDAYKTTLEYLKSLKSQVKKAYESDIDLSELNEHIDLSKFNHLKHAKELAPHNAKNYYEQLEWE